jgi:hypothetical protein
LKTLRALQHTIWTLSCASSLLGIALQTLRYFEASTLFSPLPMLSDLGAMRLRPAANTFSGTARRAWLLSVKFHRSAAAVSRISYFLASRAMRYCHKRQPTLHCSAMT